MSTRFLLVATFLSATFLSFAQSQQSTAGEVSPPSASAPNQPDQFAYLHVYRQHRYVGAALAPTVTVDETKVARVGSGRRFTAKLTPGTHSIRSDDKSSAVTLDAVAGQH